MAKSTGNNILPEDLFTGNNDVLSKSYSPSVARFFMLQANYRSILDFSDEALTAAEKGFQRLMDAIAIIPQLKNHAGSSFDVKQWREECYKAMNDDFNSPILIAKLFDAVKQINSIAAEKGTITKEDQELLSKTMHEFSFDVLGLVPTNSNNNVNDNNTTRLENLVELLIELRNKARTNRDFALSDQIRDELAKLNIELKDSREGTSFNL